MNRDMGGSSKAVSLLLCELLLRISAAGDGSGLIITKAAARPLKRLLGIRNNVSHRIPGLGPGLRRRKSL